jgi:putative ABC transport system permease protein
MKYFHLIWAALFRRTSRTVLILVSIVAAFLLFGMLDVVREAFSAGNTAIGAGRLITTSTMSMQQPLPESLDAKIQAVPGVSGVASANWFVGQYQDPKNQLISLAVSPSYFDLYPELSVPADQHAVWDRTQTGVIVGAQLAKKFGWKIGDKIPLHSTNFPQADGEKNWTFDIVGIFHVTDQKKIGQEQLMLFHWKYFDENYVFSTSSVNWYVVKVADPSRAGAVAKAIDTLSKNSDHETKTQTEQAFQASFIKRLVNIGFIVNAIVGAVFFTLLLLIGNNLMQVVHERTSELAVLKTIGFTDTRVLLMVIAEGVLLLLLGGVIGLTLVSMIVPGLSMASGGMLPIHKMSAQTWLNGVLLMLFIGVLVGLLPGLRAMRLNIVDALSGR